MKKNKYLQNYWKTIICDVDDTISVTTTHDWENATPNNAVINKINKLYNNGWTVILMTARGQVSCNGNFKTAAEKYRTKMEAWLKKHEVKYHMLSFEKYLASYYVDDKSLTPQQFIDLDIRDLQTGWSGASVEKRGDRVFKTLVNYPEALNESIWYNMAAPLINAPIVYNVIGNTIALEYLEDNGQHFKIEDINNVIHIFSLYRTYIPFEKYIERIEAHCKVNDDFYEILPLLKEKEEYFNKYNTFCHGDFSIENIIQTDKGTFLIDPIWNVNNWSSYLLDISKMMHSYRKFNRMFEYEVFLNSWIKNGDDLEEYSLKLLEITQFIRIIKYQKNIEIKKEFTKITKQLLQNIIKQ
jgi:capsule biosynthesis phosphatase